MSDMAAALLDRQDRVIAAIAVEGAPAESLPAIRNARGAPRRVMRDLAAKIREESSVQLSHYDHIAADTIAF